VFSNPRLGTASRPVPVVSCLRRRGRNGAGASSGHAPLFRPGAEFTEADSVAPVQCPSCHADDTKVVDSRLAEEATAVRRRRQCLSCSYRFTTFERVDEVPLVVVKADGQQEPFDRAKIVAGITAATKGRRVDPAEIERIAVSIEDAVRLQGSQVSSAQIGVAVLDRLRTLDEVAYLRFASVYKNFDAAADFHREIELLGKLAAS
jgi:transcriptional repressor NrdR